jgi:hypothetical protein
LACAKETAALVREAKMGILTSMPAMKLLRWNLLKNWS